MVRSMIYTPGALAAGMSAVIEVECWADEAGVVNTEAAIETEAEHFFIPISAVVLPPDQYEAWETEGGQLPCNVTTVDQPPRRMVRSKAPTVATLRRQLAEKREAVAMGKEDGGSHKMHDLQDPVPEPHVPSIETDWFVDSTRHVSLSVFSCPCLLRFRRPRICACLSFLSRDTRMQTESVRTRRFQRTSKQDLMSGVLSCAVIGDQRNDSARAASRAHDPRGAFTRERQSQSHTDRVTDRVA